MEIEPIWGRWEINKDFPLSEGQVEIDGKYIKFHFTDYQHGLNRFNAKYEKVISIDTNKGPVTLLHLDGPGWSLNPANNYKRYTYFVQNLLIGTNITEFDTVCFQLDNLTKAFRKQINSNYKQLKKQRNIILKLEEETLKVGTTQYEIEIISRTLQSVRDMAHSYIPSVSVKLKFDMVQSIDKIIHHIESITELSAFLTNQYSLPKEISLFNTELSDHIPTKLISQHFFGEEKLYDHIQPLFSIKKEKSITKNILKKWPDTYHKNNIYFNIFNSNKKQNQQYLDNIFFNTATIIDNKLQNIYGKKLKKDLYSDVPYTYIKERLSNPKNKYSHFKDRLLKHLYSRKEVLNHSLHAPFFQIKIPNKLQKEQNEIITDLIIDTRNDIAHGSKRKYSDYLWQIWKMTWIITLDLLLIELGLTSKQAKEIISNQNLN